MITINQVVYEDNHTYMCVYITSAIFFFSLSLSLYMSFCFWHSHQIFYILGTQFFFEDNFAAAHSAFIKCNNLFSFLPLDHQPPFIDTSQLRGFLVACDGLAAVRMEGGVDVGNGEKEERMGVVNRLERLRLEGNFEAVGQVLLDDLATRDFPSVVTNAVEKEVSDWSESLAAMETLSKRPRLSQLDFTSSVSLTDRVCICNGVRCVLEGKSPQCQFWQLLSKENGHHLEYVLHVRVYHFHQHYRRVSVGGDGQGFAKLGKRGTTPSTLSSKLTTCKLGGCRTWLQSRRQLF